MAEGEPCHLVEQRLKELERLIFGQKHLEEYLSIDLLLDALIVLYDECCHSTLRKEKSVSDFIERGLFCKIIYSIFKCNV